jgi:hypothetical protein
LDDTASSSSFFSTSTSSCGTIVPSETVRVDITQGRIEDDGLVVTGESSWPDAGCRILGTREFMPNLPGRRYPSKPRCEMISKKQRDDGLIKALCRMYD